MDTPIRSWAKSITWRVIGIVLLGLITYLITHDWKEMAVITVVFGVYFTKAIVGNEAGLGDLWPVGR